MAEKRNAHSASDFGEGKRCGRDEDGRQMELSSTSSANDSTNSPCERCTHLHACLLDSGFEPNADNCQLKAQERMQLARERAAEAMERNRECPEMLEAVRSFCKDCVSKGRRIETHAAFGYVKNHNFVSHTTGQDFDLNNNHTPFYLRLLAHEDEEIARHLRLRRSMFDLLDMSTYAADLRRAAL